MIDVVKTEGPTAGLVILAKLIAAAYRREHQIDVGPSDVKSSPEPKE